jgi:lysine-specific demethylase/histidyl-hydroxylase NO66
VESASGVEWFGRKSVIDDGLEALARCTGDPELFLANQWTRSWALHREPAGFADLLDLDAVDEIIATRQLRLPALRLVSGGRPISSDTVLRPVSVGPQPLSDSVDAGRAFAAFDAGATLILQGLQHWWPPLTAFCSALGAALSHGSRANSYLTPAGAVGLGRHYDTHDVFVLQVSGRKKWVLEEPVVSRPLASQRWVDIGGDDPLPASTVEAELELGPGSCLYLPRGVIHSAMAQDDASLHITIGVDPVTVEAALRLLLADEAKCDEALRAALPAGYAWQSPSCADPQVTVLSEDYKGELFVRAVSAASERFWLTHHRSPARSRLMSIVRARSVDRETRVHRPRLTVVRAEVGTENFVLTVGDREILLPLHAAGATRRLLGGDPVTADELPGPLETDGRLALIRQLLREGLIQVVDGPVDAPVR